MRQRIDVLLVERGLAPSRERARAFVLAGIVFSGERKIDKAGDLVDASAPLEVRGADHPYVSRGGVKLEGALAHFGLDVTGLVCADFGASTGGFTDCLLSRGARKVHAIDVGRGQLHQRLRTDPRVIVRERTNARHLRRGDLGEPIDLVVIDASFIGLALLLPAAIAILREGGEIVAMVKPQFEVERGEHKKGVVRDPGVRERAIEKVEHAAKALGLELLGRVDSALAGPDGNVEAFLWLRVPRSAG